MRDVTDAEIHERLRLLEASLPGVVVREQPQRRTKVSLLLALLAAALLIAFGLGVSAGHIGRDGVIGHEDVFGPGQVLACSSVRNMVPSDAAPLLAALGYHVTWQLEGFPNTRSNQTEVPPNEGHIFGGFARGNELVLIVEHDQLAQGDPCLK